MSERNSSRSSSLRFLEPDFETEGPQDGPSGRSRASTIENRKYGALPRALGSSTRGREAGILSEPYKRYGSPYPGRYQPVPDHGPGGASDSEDAEETEDNSSIHSDVDPTALLSKSLTDSSINTDQGDESLQRYKESLGLGGGNDISDPNDPRVCIIYSLAMHSEGREPVVIDLSTPGSELTLKEKPFKIKEGAKFTMTAKFRVQHEILSGLHYVQSIKRKGVRLPGGKTSEMIASSSHVLRNIALSAH